MANMRSLGKGVGIFSMEWILFWLEKTRMTPLRVVGAPEQQRKDISEVHDEYCQLGREARYGLVKRRYQWKHTWDDVVEFCKTCEVCQRQSQVHYEEPLLLNWASL
jgi:Integrase zinc binding domain